VLTASNATAVIDSAYAVNAIIYTSNADQCAQAYTDSFTYRVVDISSAESPIGTVNISANAFNCLPVSTAFTETITGTATIDFSTHVSDQETTAANLTIKVETLPSKGVLTASNATAVEGTAYAISAITYTSNASECAATYSDSFSYTVTDANSVESSASTVNISATAHNCAPVSTAFTKIVTEQPTMIDFTTHVSDNETAATSLTIKLTSLPANGVLTTSDGNAAIGTAYAVSALSYTTQALNCDKFNYKVVDPSSLESSVSTVNITAG